MARTENTDHSPQIIVYHASRLGDAGCAIINRRRRPYRAPDSACICVFDDTEISSTPPNAQRDIKPAVLAPNHPAVLFISPRTGPSFSFSELYTLKAEKVRLE